ncbi:MAG: hypothetical protein AAFP89_23180 [Bacteroidota bacterium]
MTDLQIQIMGKTIAHEFSMMPEFEELQFAFIELQQILLETALDESYATSKRVVDLVYFISRLMEVIRNPDNQKTGAVCQ